jgi:LmbE family N-acetylglucosaminyl deacetylase
MQLLENIDKILVISAHPDDPELSSGGSIAKWVAGGKEVIYIICTDGDKGSKDINMNPHRLAALREQEQEAAAHTLGVQRVIFLRHQDGELEVNPLFKVELTMLIRHIKPELIITHDPWRPYLIHPDHRAVGLAVTDAVIAARDHLFFPVLLELGLKAHRPKALYYTFPEKPDIILDITEFMELKLKAIAQHKTQIETIPNWQERIRQMGARFGEKEGFPYAEIFKQVELL